MKKILIVLAVMAFPHTGTLSTVCSAGVSCYVNSDGSCAFEGAMCGPISQGKHCRQTDNPLFAGAAAKGESLLSRLSSTAATVRSDRRFVERPVLDSQ